MPHPDAERISRLQRIAYGAGSDDEERAAARAELAALSGPSGSGAEPVPDGASGAAGTAVAGSSDADGDLDAFAALLGGAATDVAGESVDGTDDDASPAHGLRPRPGLRREVVAVAAAALAVGVVIGWAGGSSIGSAGTPTAGAILEPTPAPMIGVVVDPGSVEVASSPAAAVFDREQLPADRPARPFASDSTVDPASTRLLGERDGGVRLFAARRLDLPDVCLFAETPDVTAGVCTSGGFFPSEGLRIRGTFEGSYAGLGAFWMSNGDAGFTLTSAAAG